MRYIILLLLFLFIVSCSPKLIHTIDTTTDVQYIDTVIYIPTDTNIINDLNSHLRGFNCDSVYIALQISKINNTDNQSEKLRLSNQTINHLKKRNLTNTVNLIKLKSKLLSLDSLNLRLANTTTTIRNKTVVLEKYFTFTDKIIITLIMMLLVFIFIKIRRKWV